MVLGRDGGEPYDARNDLGYNLPKVYTNPFIYLPVKLLKNPKMNTQRLRIETVTFRDFRSLVYV